MAYRRTLGAETTLVVTNYGRKSATIRLDQLKSSAGFASAFPQGGKAVSANAAGVLSVQLPAQSVRVYTLKP
jgi:hypothetical protein